MKVVIFGKPEFKPANIFTSDANHESMKSPIYDVDEKDFNDYHKIRVEIWSKMVYLEGSYKRMMAKRVKLPLPKPITITTGMAFWDRLKFLFKPSEFANRVYDDNNR